MTKLLAAQWSDPSVKWSEDDHQLAVVQWLRRNGYAFAADQNAGRRSARDGARRKALGMAAGEPDLRIYLAGGTIVFIEMKAWTGQVSKEQKTRFALLRGLGFAVHVVREQTPAAAIAAVSAILSSYASPVGAA